VVPEVAGALLALWNDVAPVLEAEYEDWHANEHVPERCTVPGILWGRRYRHERGSAMPRYLTLYGLRDPQVLDGEPYLRLLREPTPASRRMRPALLNVSRWVCRLHADTLEGGRSLSVRVLDTERPSMATGTPGQLLGERLLQASPLPWLAAGQDRGIEGHWLICAELDGDRSFQGSWPDAAFYTALPVA
jgi:hypothetical protein